jgi:hypothetical protein
MLTRFGSSPENREQAVKRRATLLTLGHDLILHELALMTFLAATELGAVLHERESQYSFRRLEKG